jgi:hypothetical protein
MLYTENNELFFEQFAKSTVKMGEFMLVLFVLMKHGILICLCIS